MRLKSGLLAFVLTLTLLLLLLPVSVQAEKAYGDLYYPFGEICDTPFGPLSVVINGTEAERKDMEQRYTAEVIPATFSNPELSVAEEIKVITPHATLPYFDGSSEFYVYSYKLKRKDGSELSIDELYNEIGNKNIEFAIGLQTDSKLENPASYFIFELSVNDKNQIDCISGNNHNHVPGPNAEGIPAIAFMGSPYYMIYHETAKTLKPDDVRPDSSTPETTIYIKDRYDEALPRVSPAGQAILENSLVSFEEEGASLEGWTKTEEVYVQQADKSYRPAEENDTYEMNHLYKFVLRLTPPTGNTEIPNVTISKEIYHNIYETAARFSDLKIPENTPAQTVNRAYYQQKADGITIVVTKRVRPVARFFSTIKDKDNTENPNVTVAVRIPPEKQAEPDKLTFVAKKVELPTLEQYPANWKLNQISKNHHLAFDVYDIQACIREASGSLKPLSGTELRELLGPDARFFYAIKRSFSDHTPYHYVTMPYTTEGKPDLTRIHEERLGRHPIATTPASIIFGGVDTTYVEAEHFSLHGLMYEEANKEPVKPDPAEPVNPDPIVPDPIVPGPDKNPTDNLLLPGIDSVYLGVEKAQPEEKPAASQKDKVPNTGAAATVPVILILGIASLNAIKLKQK